MDEANKAVSQSEAIKKFTILGEDSLYDDRAC